MRLSDLQTANQRLKRLSSKRPPYTKYAFLNPYNLSLLVGAGVAVLATGFWPLGVAAAAGEALWMLFAPDSKLLKRVWFDKTWQQECAEKRAEIRESKRRLLDAEENGRVDELLELKARIQKLAAENPTFTGELLAQELERLDDLIDDFIDVTGVCRRYREHLETIDVDRLEEDERRYSEEVKELPSGEEQRVVAQKNLEVVLTRKKRKNELGAHLHTAVSQLDLIENTLRLLADDIVTMRSPAEFGDRLEDLRAGVEAVRETSRETEQPENLYQRA